MSKRITRDDCLQEAYTRLTKPTNRADWAEVYALEAQSWLMLARELEKGSLRVEQG